MSLIGELRMLKLTREEIMVDLEVLSSHLEVHKMLIDELAQVNEDIAELEQSIRMEAQDVEVGESDE